MFSRFQGRDTSPVVDPGSIWKFQYEKVAIDPIYKLVNLTGGGMLIDAYDEGGIREPYKDKRRRVWKFAKEYIPQFLQDEPKNTTKREYAKWTNTLSRDLENYLKLISSVDSEHRRGSSSDGAVYIPTYEDFEKAGDSPFTGENTPCYWKMKKRGVLGETAFHLLILNDSTKHFQIARMLLELFPALAVDQYMGPDYFGQTALHLAIIYNNYNLVRGMLNTNYCNIHARARGTFFLPLEFRKPNMPMTRTKYQRLYAYYGEYPLSFAASTENTAVYDLLLDNGADVNAQDDLGNTALHLTVIHDKLNMFHHAINRAEYPANPSIKNKQGYTPMVLAAFLGKQEMFEGIMKKTSKKFWSINNIVCSGYPLKDLDSINPQGNTNWNSALIQIIHNNSNEHLDMLQADVITRLLQEKWDVFGKRRFFEFLIYHIVHILFLSCAVYIRPNDITQLATAADPSSIARYCFEIITVLMSIYALLYSFVRIKHISTIDEFWMILRSMPTRILYYLACILMLVCIPARFLKLVDLEDWLLTFAIPFFWSYFFFFARGFFLTGPFVTMLYRMIRTNLVIFFIIYIIVWLASGVVFYYLFKDQGVKDFKSPLDTFMSLLQMSLGDFSYEINRMSKQPAMTYILFIFFMLIAHVLLLNVLIAMLTRTYQTVINKTEKEWRRQWASIIMIIERAYSREDRLHFQDMYSIDMSNMVLGNTKKLHELSRTNVKDRGLLSIQDMGASTGKRKAAVTGMWKTSKRAASKRPLYGAITLDRSSELAHRPAYKVKGKDREWQTWI